MKLERKNLKIKFLFPEFEDPFNLVPTFRDLIFWGHMFSSQILSIIPVLHIFMHIMVIIYYYASFIHLFRNLVYEKIWSLLKFSLKFAQMLGIISGPLSGSVQKVIPNLSLSSKHKCDFSPM